MFMWELQVDIMPEEKLFGFPMVLILLLIFLAIFITVAYMLTPQIYEGWVTFVLSLLFTPP